MCYIIMDDYNITLGGGREGKSYDYNSILGEATLCFSDSEEDGDFSCGNYTNNYYLLIISSCLVAISS